MKHNIINQVSTGVLGALLLLGAPACTDDHYDIKPGSESAVNTIWKNIQAKPELDSLAMILNRVRVYSKEDDNHRTMTYAQLLDQPQVFTFWAPVNGTYNAKQYLDKLDSMADMDSASAAKVEYEVGVQFIQNHMARFNDESNRESHEIRLFNGKNCVYNPAEHLFNNVQVSSEFLPSSNGVVHLLDQKSSPFSYNIYDYLAANHETFDSVYGTLSDPKIDNRKFAEELSIPGALNEFGKMVYVDSVFVTNNELLNQSGAQIKNEDSLYIATIPTDAAWDEAYAKVAKIFNYGKHYRYKYTNKKTFELKADLNADSLVNYNTKKAIITSMYFSPSIFGTQFDRDETAQMLDYAYNADSLISTNHVIYYNYNKGGKNPIFGDVEPVLASNGIIFPLTSYDMDPSYSFLKKERVDLLNEWNIGGTDKCANGSHGELLELVEGQNWDTDIDLSMLDNKRYRYFQSDTEMKVYIPIPNLYSGKYTIKIQMLPNRVDVDHKWQHKETGEEVVADQQFRASLTDDEGKTIVPKTKPIVINNDSVMTYTLWESVEIPKCYVNLPSGIDKSFPILELHMPRANNPVKVKDVINPIYGLSVVQLIIEPVHE